MSTNHLFRGLAYLLAVLALIGARAAWAAPPAPVRVAVFDDPVYVDTMSAAPDAESDNLQASLAMLGASVAPFTGTSEAAWRAAAANADVLLVPEQEFADLAAALDENAEQALVDFVTAGGVLIVHGNTARAQGLLNAVFGFTSAVGVGGIAGLADAASASTRFAYGPATLAVNNGSTWVTGLTNIYSSGAAGLVARQSFGAGKVIFLGWDWWNAVPIGTQDGGWNEVLRRAILEGRPPQRRVAVYADPAYVDMASPLPEAEARNVQAALLSRDLLTSRSIGVDFQAFGAPRKPDVDVLDVPELDADLGANMDANSRARVRNFVGSGGTLILHGGASPYAANFLNLIFELSTSTQLQPLGSISQRTGDTADTLFGSSPPTLTNFLDCSALQNLPPGSRSIYTSGGGATVALIPYGEGRIVFLGWDWILGAPIGGNDGGWLDLLELAARTSPPARRVAVFANESFVDAVESPADPGIVAAEGVAVTASLRARGHVASLFTATDHFGWARALAGADVLLIPELENAGNLYATLDAATRNELLAFVRRGGLLVMSVDLSSRGTAFLTNLLGQTFTTVPAGGASTKSLNSFATPFETAVENLPIVSAVFAVTGPLTPIYTSPGGTTVGRIPLGVGEILVLGWDFFNAGPAGGPSDGGWIDVLDLAVQAARPRARHVAVFGDESYVDLTSPTPFPAAETVPEGLALFDHTVSEIAEPSAAAFRSALGGADALLIPKQHFAPLTPALGNEARHVLRDFVAAGGALIVHGDTGTRASELLNAVFGWQVVQQPTAAGASGGNAPGTRFMGGPEILPFTPGGAALSEDSLPLGSVRAWAELEADTYKAVVADMPYGRGRVIYLGWGFADPPAPGAASLEWLEVLDRAVQEARPRTRRVALFADGGYVDTTPGGEVLNAYRSLEALGQTVTAFYELYPYEWSNAFARSQAVFLPELENRDLNADIDPSSPLPQYVRDFVARGGTFVASQTFDGSTLSFLNRVFGFSLVLQDFSAPEPFARSAAAAGTVFATGPAELEYLSAVYGAAGLPAGAVPLYANAEGTAVALIPYGAGQVVVLGWDFFGARPYQNEERGQAAWRDVLRRALELSPPDARHVAVFDDPSVVDTNDTPTAESDNVQAALLQNEHAVVPFTGTSFASWTDALSRADVVLVPEQENALLAPLLDAATRNALRGFVEGGGNLLPQGIGAAELVNALYGTAIAIDPITDGQSTLQSTAALGTPFSGAPSPLGALAGGKGWLATSFPGDARLIYRTVDPGNPVTLLTLPRGSGRVVMTGFPWYDVVPYGSQNDGFWNDVLDRAVREGPGGDADEDGVAIGDVCPLSADPLQLDADADGAGDLCDNCVSVANARVTPSDASFFGINDWASLTGGQRDDDLDGYGNRCDAKFPFTAGTLVGAPDLVQLRASLGESRMLDTCGSTSSLPCAIFDLDEIVTLVSAGDVARFRTRLGKLPGPRCAICPLPCTSGPNGSCEKPVQQQ